MAKPNGSDAIGDRLLPLPRAVSCDGWWDVEPGELRVVCDGDHDTLRLAADELAEFLCATGRPGSDALTLVVTSGESHALPAAGYQRYAIEPEARGLRLIGAEPVGAYYAVKTLKQLVERGDGRVRVPRVRVSDSADLAERGFWDYFYPCPIRETSEMYALGTAERWFAFIDDLADYKINLMELLIADEGLYYNSTRFPELVKPGTPADKEAIVHEVLRYARRRGVRVYLQLCHPEHFSSLMAAHPELAAKDPAGCQPSLFPHLFCLSHPKTREVLGGVLEEVGELFDPDGIEVWMPENLGRCTCDACRDKGYLPQFFSIFTEPFARVRRRRPGLAMRFLISFLHYSDAVLKMVPDEAELVYYECDRHGMYCHDDDKRLSPYVAAAARSGRRVLGCTSFRASGQKYVPLPTLRHVAEWVRLMVRDGYYGVNGSMYSNPAVCRLNLLRMVDVAWNAAGRDTDGFLRAYCVRHGMERPMARAAILRAIADGWDLYHSKLGRLMEPAALDWLLELRPGSTVDGFYITDKLEFHDLPVLARGLADLDAAHALAEGLSDDDLARQVRVCRIRLGALYHILSTLRVYGRQQLPDPEKGAWGDWVAEIVGHLQQARDLLNELPEVTRHIVSTFPGTEGDPSVTDEKCLERIDKALAPEFLDALAAKADA